MISRWLIGARLRVLLSRCSGAVRYGVSGNGAAVVSPRAVLFRSSNCHTGIG